MPKIRILVVDDSVVVRRMVSNILDGDPALEVVATAANGHIALAKIPQVNPDLILLDVEMPEMDGLQTLAAIRKQDKYLPVIMFSALTELGAAATLDALTLGATDYVTKPHNMKSKEEALQHIQKQLIPKIKIFGGSTGRIGEIQTANVKRQNFNIPSAIYTPSQIPNPKSQIDIVAIGVSTGGPNALETVLRQFPANFPVPIAIVQHMPPVFTKRLAERLGQKCQIRVAEGYTSGILEPGLAWIAPGDYHMVVERQGTSVKLRTHQEPPENSCRPAVDVLFRSVAKTYGAGTLAVVLTGMGQDGWHGCQYIREVGGQVIVQDEATSVVWGMPGIVANSGLAERVVPLDEIASEIMSRVS
ncbi:MAG TPA: chemotaxis response regulator protein-glutamate methylesterase [Cyanobacteria bacterium UBA8803]|nr:chemotaxis response regulator protein-glutamate methylesterase [Cyanobacteria bacterium UBA9273]HBL57438.1 chemotaxis response regulator protein-glutamate methylesterase [Cyanobacteria bacterium UBA8803]